MLTEVNFFIIHTYEEGPSLLLFDKYINQVVRWQKFVLGTLGKGRRSGAMKYCTASRKQFVLLVQIRVEQMVPDWNEVVAEGIVFLLIRNIFNRMDKGKVINLWINFYKSKIKFFNSFSDLLNSRQSINLHLSTHHRSLYP